MLRRKITKISFVLACIVTLVMPYMSSVLAVKLGPTDTSVNLIAIDKREGGEEATGTLTEEQTNFYDTTSYEYYVGGDSASDVVLKIVTNENPIEYDNIYDNIFYCIDYSKQFPYQQGGLNFNKVADMKDSTDANVKSLHLSAEQAENNEVWTENYKALIWLFDNMYLKNVEGNQKDEFLRKAFENSTYADLLDNVKAVLTDDDIEVIQQYAIWYFTNKDYPKQEIVDGEEINIYKFDINNFPSVHVKESFGDGETKTYNEITIPAGGHNYGENGINRQEMANILFLYLINSAKNAANGSSSDDSTFPTIKKGTATGRKTDDNYIVVGPWEIEGGTADSSEYKIYLTDQNNNRLNSSDYKVLIDGETEFTTKELNEIKDSSIYVYIPKANNEITRLTLNLEYNKYVTDASLWKSSEEHQPVVLLDRTIEPQRIPISYDIENPEFDLALRKYIVKVNNTSVNMAPTVDTSKLKSGEAKTATYKHAKTPVEVSAGDKIVFEIRVYNEGELDAKNTIINEALPDGLELVEDSNINETYGWEEKAVVGNHKVYSSEYLKNEVIKAYDKQEDDLVDNSKYVQIECKIADNATASSVLTNIAEIAGTPETDDGSIISDRDSNPENNDYINNNQDSSGYTGDRNNKSDLTDDDYFYKGLQDDDDFSKVVIKGKNFDLNLKKFISKVNGKNLDTDRAPKVDVSKLKNGTKSDADYSKVSSAISVKKGDIITYTLRVYNEGELSGYAEEVADYLPEGLGYLVGYKGNTDNMWKIPSSNIKTVKLKTIDGGTNNLKATDFEGISNLDDVDVVTGKVKITSTLLASSTDSNKNLLKAFNRDTDINLDYKDIQVTCIVIADEITNNNGKNIAEIVKETDENGTEITDIDSTPDTVDPDKYPDTEKRPDGTNQDDNDYEDIVTPKAGTFDLSLQKFITGVNNSKVTGREPTVSKTNDGKIKFTKSSTDAIAVENNDLITYTIRVYNEGTIAGYAKEVSDNIPNGLEFVLDNETNKKYGWKLYDKNGNVTSDVNQATSVKTDYLSKSVSEAGKYDALLKAFDPSKAASTISYKDIEIVFKVVESEASKNEGRNIINIAEITDDEDENGNPIDDIDSTPGNNKPGEDDIDQEKLYVKYFDLALQKYLSKIIIIENGSTREISVSPTDGLQKVEINRKRINSTTVKFVYDIVVRNEGQIDGYATEITDYVPDGLEFVQEDNKLWTKGSGNQIKTEALSNTLLKPGDTATVQVTLKWINGENNFNLKTNIAEISKDKNNSNTPDRDSTPGNNKPGEDDIDSADVILGISTGIAPTYITLSITVLVILSTGITLIKKYVL